MIKGYTRCTDTDIEPRIAMQIVNESALCNNRIRKKNYIAHQGFEVLNGLGFLASDEQVHCFLDGHTVQQARSLQETLSLIRYQNGHYTGDIIAIDPHRIITTTKRTAPKKKKQPTKPAEKMLQTFFAVNTQTGQPYAFGMGSSVINTTTATADLVDLIHPCTKPDSLILADKEHFTESLIKNIHDNYSYELLVPAISTQRIQKIERTLNYKRYWAGFAIAESLFDFAGQKEKYRLISQREGETERDYVYKSFITLSDKPAEVLLSELYDKRWSIEDFFNFEGAMGFDRASTLNINIRYGKMSLALIAQAATYEFRKKLPDDYQRWNAIHLAEAIFNKITGDIRVENDTIIVTCYNVPEEYNLQSHYQNLPKILSSQGINPRIPWLYNFKLDFRFK